MGDEMTLHDLRKELHMGDDMMGDLRTSVQVHWD